MSETNIAGTKMLEKTNEDLTKVNREPVKTKADRELDNTMLAKCNLKLAEYHDDVFDGSLPSFRNDLSIRTR